MPRFDVVYHFYSTMHMIRVRLKTRVTEAEPAVDSLVSLYGSANFMERECHDMYGIAFRGNPAQNSERCQRCHLSSREQAKFGHSTHANHGISCNDCHATHLVERSSSAAARPSPARSQRTTSASFLSRRRAGKKKPRSRGEGADDIVSMMDSIYDFSILPS